MSLSESNFTFSLGRMLVVKGNGKWFKGWIAGVNITEHPRQVDR